MLNILICGTPGTGKSSLIKKLKPLLPKFNFLNISEFAIENKFVTLYDDTFSSHVLDEEKLFDALIPLLEKNKFNIIESIHADSFDNEEIDYVFVCRASNTNVHDRLKERGYSDIKLDNNVQAEIFQTIYDEAHETFTEDKIIQLHNDVIEDLDKNVAIIKQKIDERIKKE